MPIQTIENLSQFTEQVVANDCLYVIDFYADWCGPCKIMYPIFEKVTSELETNQIVQFLKINRDFNSEIIEKFGFSIPTIPRFFVIKVEAGKVTILEDMGGTQSKSSMIEKIQAHLPSKVTQTQTVIQDSESQPRVAIIGSGPAGLTAAIYMARADLDITVYTGLMPGGQLTTTTEIENFPGAWDKNTKEGMMGPDLMENIRLQAEHFGAQFELEQVNSLIQKSGISKPQFELMISNGKTETFDAVVIASGATARYLGIEGEEQWVGKGYHSCATCDGFFYRNKVVAVVGGGDTAMEEATFLTKFASKLYLIHRSENFRASKVMLDRARNNPKIEFITNAQITTLEGDEKIHSVVIESTGNATLSSGALTKLDGKEYRLELNAVFVAIGHDPATEFIGNLLDKDASGYLIPQSRLPLDERTSHFNLATKIPGIFIAGDVEDSIYRQAITAAGDGCRAAIECAKWLEDTTDSI
jgi:thioredoxin reductase (NADPH)